MKAAGMLLDISHVEFEWPLRLAEVGAILPGAQHVY
jgi:hypothetical protein